MIAKISTKGQMVIPEAIRKQAHLRAGDEVEVGIADGLVVLRKRVPLTPARVRSLLLSGNALPAITEADEAAVAQAVQRIRRRRGA